MSDLNPRERELVALGAAMGSNCVPCVEYHIPESRKVGLTDPEIQAAIQYADKVRQVPARKTLQAALKLLSTASEDVRNAAMGEGCGCGVEPEAAASRVAADYFRHPGRKTRIVELDEVVELINSDRAIDERLVIDEMNECVRQVIDGLPDAYREAIILHDLEGLSAEQTAEICDCSVASAKIRIHRARLRLKEALKAQCEFYRDPDSVFRCDRKA